MASKSSPLTRFFARFPAFTYNPNASASAEFYRLCKPSHRGRAIREQVYQDFKDALTQQFNAYYGTDPNDINAWQRICARTGIDPLPTTLKKCRQTVLRTHVNLVDLVDVYPDGGRATTYSTVEELSRYSKANGKIFPKGSAYAGNLLKLLLRNISNPSQDDRGQGNGARGNRGRKQLHRQRERD